MRNILLAFAIFCCLVPHAGWAQSNSSKQAEICGSNFDPEKLKKYSPEQYNDFLRREKKTRDFLIANGYVEESKGQSTKGTTVQRVTDPQVTVTIPVVVHVVWNTAEQNIGLAQIQSQIDALNEDFRRRNADASQTPAAFQGVAADANIEFKLACIAPDGSPTDGIVRAFTNQGGYTFVPLNALDANEAAIGVKFVPGAEAWPADRYLNVWTCNFTDGTGGYAQFPGRGAPNTDGVVVAFNAFGRTGTLLPNYNKGRITAHEIGHWLDLRHIWGDANCGDDFCSDTPTQAGPNTGCPTFPKASCSNQGDMSMNYMDYTNDACRNMFTNVQKGRMRALFAAGGSRESFISAKIQQQAPQVCGAGPFVFSVAANVGASVNYAWSVTPPLQITSGQGTNQITCSSTSNGTAAVTVSANGFCDSKAVQVGDGSASLTSSASYYGYVCPDGPVSFTVDRTNQFQSESYTWFVNGVPFYNQGSSFQITGPQAGQSTHVRVVINNPCDGQYELNQTVYGASEIDGLPCQNVRIGAELCVAAYPNPADAFLILEQAAGAVSTIYDSQGKLVYTAKRGKHTATVDTYTWPNGFYYLHTQTNKHTERCRIQVQHP